MMILTIILAEISVVLFAVVIVIGIKALRRRRRDQDAVNTLVISIKANQPARVERLVGMLKDKSNLSEEDALAKAKELIKKQNKFCQDAVDLYLTRNNEILSKLDNRLEDLLGQYRGFLQVTTQENTGVDAEAMEQFSKDISALSKEIEGLRSENSTLITQLKAAENELDQLGREYVSAFNKPKVDKPKDEKTTEEDKEDKEERSEESPVVENDETPVTNDKQAVVESVQAKTEPSTEVAEPHEVEEADDMQIAVVESTVDETPTLEVEKPTPNTATTDDKAKDKLDTNASTMDDSGDQNLFADLGLDELIGEQPGQPMGVGKTAEKK